MPELIESKCFGFSLINNQIRELQPDTFNNLPNLKIIVLLNTQIKKLQSNQYYGLSDSVKISI